MPVPENVLRNFEPRGRELFGCLRSFRSPDEKVGVPNSFLTVCGFQNPRLETFQWSCMDDVTQTASSSTFFPGSLARSDSNIMQISNRQERERDGSQTMNFAAGTKAAFLI